MTKTLLSLSDNEIINRLITNPQLTSAFPFVKSVATAHRALGTCATCQKTAKRAAYVKAVEELRHHIASMNDGDRQRFKSILGVQRVRFWYTYWDGSVQRRKQVDF